MHYHTTRGEYTMGNFSMGRFPEMYITLEGTPFANCPALLVVIALLVVAGCVAPPLYVYRRKIYYKMVMVVYRRRKDKLARELKKRMKVYTEDTSQIYRTDGKRGSEINMNCLICMDALLDVKTTDLVILLDACGHRFHFKCILKWLDMSDGCPICRKTVDVNDRKALRLVYLDCRPQDGDDKDGDEDEANGTVTEETEMLPAAQQECSHDNEHQGSVSITVDIDNADDPGEISAGSSYQCCPESPSTHSIDLTETEAGCDVTVTTDDCASSQENYTDCGDEDTISSPRADEVELNKCIIHDDVETVCSVEDGDNDTKCDDSSTDCDVSSNEQNSSCDAVPM